MEEIRFACKMKSGRFAELEIAMKGDGLDSNE